MLREKLLQQTEYEIIFVRNEGNIILEHCQVLTHSMITKRRKGDIWMSFFAKVGKDSVWFEALGSWGASLAPLGVISGSIINVRGIHF